MISIPHLQDRTKALFRSYIQDWGLVLIVLVSFGFIDQVEPYHRQFSVTNLSIQHPFAKQETVPVWMLFTVALIIPGILMSLVAVFYKKSYTDLHNALLGLMLTQSLVLIVTDSIKITVGRPRPDFLDRCLSIYDNAAAGTPVGPLYDPINMLSTSAICTRRELLRDGFKAFPSGHSSFSFGGLGFLAMYLAGKLHLFDERGHIYKSLIVLTPVIGAALIATSRVGDYRHHWEDVTVGSFIGAVAAVFSYRQYYPSLASVKCDSPFKPRVEDTAFTGLPLHNDYDHPDYYNNNGRYQNGQRYRDDDEGDEGVTRGSIDATASGEGRGITEQFFRRDETEDTLSSGYNQQQSKSPRNSEGSRSNVNGNGNGIGNGNGNASSFRGQAAGFYTVGQNRRGSSISQEGPNGAEARLIPI
ncbi:hypothetical protein BG004_007126 [Podila humilis]|nr:hypothetical protein BG004_007126 [Podila humilis]